jgi:hypothetical protein
MVYVFFRQERVQIFLPSEYSYNNIMYVKTHTGVIIQVFLVIEDLKRRKYFFIATTTRRKAYIMLKI